MNPSVCCVMLTRNRPEMARRAVECFRSQTYANKHLLIYNTGESDEIECGCNKDCFHVMNGEVRTLSIGMLRNKANVFINPYRGKPDILVHWDDDDWSHPNRIAEQVALLQFSGAECVGYRKILFWRVREQEAWLYRDAYRPVGTSLCYWRSAWERHPFPDLPRPDRKPNPDMRGEDVEWLRELKYKGYSNFPEPTIIARIHAHNSSGSYSEIGKSGWWKRTPEWDQHCRMVFA